MTFVIQFQIIRPVEDRMTAAKEVRENNASFSSCRKERKKESYSSLTSTTCACRDVSCVLRHACSNMEDDKEAVVLACKTISCFIIINLFSSQMKLYFTIHI